MTQSVSKPPAIRATTCVHRAKTWLVVVAGCALACAVASATRAEDLTYFRSDRGVAADERPLPDRFDSPDALVWRQPLGPGHSTPCISGDSIYLTTFEDGKLSTVSLDRATGKERWSRAAPATRIEPYHPTGSPAVCTPASDGERVYTFFGSYGLVCYDRAGKMIWEKPMGPFQDEFGSASSPVLIDGKLLLNEDHDLDNFLLCVDAATGKTLWRTSRDGFTRSYATPIIWPAADARRGAHGSDSAQVVVAGALRLVSYDLATGSPLWSVDGLARIVNTTPVAADGLIYVATWSPGGDADARIKMEPWDVAVQTWDSNRDGKITREETDNKEVLDRFFRIDLNQDQGIERSEWDKYARVFELARNCIMAVRPSPSADQPPHVVWQYDKHVPYVSSPLVYRGVVYVVKDGGIVTSLDGLTGRVLKAGRARGPGNYYSSPVAGDGKVYLISERGVITVLSAEGDWEVLSSHDFAERTVATPVIHDGKIYIRTEEALYCFSLPSAR